MGLSNKNQSNIFPLWKSKDLLADRQEEQSRFRSRIVFIAGFVLFAFSLLFSRFYFLQVVDHEHYITLAENNRISVVPIPPARGLILDRNGVILAHNYSAYTLEIVPSKTDKEVDKVIEDLGKLIEITSKDKKRFKKLLDESKNFESVPIRNRLTEVEVARFAANRYRFPGVELKARLFRRYPLSESMAHTVGYIGRINDKDLDKLEENNETSNYKGTDHIGKMGIEQSYERMLHGTTGVQQVETDAGGRAIRVLNKEAPTAGKNLILTIDTKLQAIAELTFGNRRGALVAINPKNGEILAMASRPSFDPNLFVDGIDPANWEILNSSIDKPLNNRALRGLYPPGSTVKPFMGLLGLWSGRRTPYTSVYDPGYFSFPGTSHRYRDWKPSGHGSVDLHRSIVVSCDTYYYSLANEVGIDLMNKFMTQFGFGRKTGIDIEGELKGVMPSKEWKRKRFKQPWFPGETVITGIGQGYTLTTPLQLAFATATLANDGKAMRPHLVRAIEDGRTKSLVEPELLYELKFNKSHLNAIRDAMTAVTRPGGTAAGVGAGSRYSIAGKTGTAQVIGIKQNEKYVESRVKERHRDHALFIAYAPAENPTIAVAVIVENGGHGGSAAGPLARRVMDYYLLGKMPDLNLQQGTNEDADTSDDGHGHGD